jgi:2-oxoglutarate ferredoxin oxidoreductase subunit delta
MTVASVASRTMPTESLAPPPPAGGADPTAFLPVEIARDHCKGCELCISVCPKNVLALDLAVVNRLGHHPVRLTDARACTSCAFCARICPDAVFTVYARPKEA